MRSGERRKAIMDNTELTKYGPTPNFHSNTRTFRDMMQPTQLPPSFRIDEGYSEDTRSQTGSETAGDANMRSDQMVNAPTPGQLLGLPDWIMALSEADRSGQSLLHRACCIPMS